MESAFSSSSYSFSSFSISSSLSAEQEEKQEEEEHELDKNESSANDNQPPPRGGGDGGPSRESLAAAIARSAIPEGEETVWDNFIEVFVDHQESPERYFMKKSIPYYFLRDELGIHEGKMLQISLYHGQVLALSVERSLRPKVKWLTQALSLTRAEAATLVGGSPGILLLSIEDNLAPKLDWLRDELGLSDAEKRQVLLKCPQILTASAGSLLLKLAFFKDDLGLSRDDIKIAVRRQPSLLILSLDNLIDKIEYLTSELHEMDLSKIASLLCRAPMFFSQSLDTGMRPKIRFLRRDMGFDDDAIVRIIMANPRLFNYNIVGRGRSFLSYMIRRPMHMSREEVQKMIVKSPSLIATDVTSSRFVEMIKTLQKAMGVTAETDLADIFQRFPMILSFTAPRIDSTITTLQDLLACDEKDMHSLISKHPQIFGYRPESIREKLSTIVNIYQLDSIRDLKAAVLKSPALLSYSLSTRIIPHLSVAYDAGIPIEKAVSWLPLSTIQFEERVRRQTTEPISLDATPLLKLRTNTKLRKLLRTPKKKKKEEEEGGGEKSAK